MSALSRHTFGLALLAASSVFAADPGQPSRQDAPLGQFEILGDSIVSAQQMFLGTLDKVYIVDKTEGNPTQIEGHPAWASEYTLSTNKGRPMDVMTNTFCAGGTVLGNGTWLNVGGNQAVTYGGLQAPSQKGGGPYDDPDGGKSLRLLDPCDDGSCDWVLAQDMSSRRWYPTVETLEDGSAIIIGGCDWGGFVNNVQQDNPTYEFFPSRGNGQPITSPLLQRTLPLNLYPLTWLLPSGKIFMQAGWETVLLDYRAKKEYALADIPDAVRVYPASAGSIMLPLTPANNWTATLLFCGGSDIPTEKWVANWNIPAHPASDSCVRITPDESKNYEDDEPLPEGRTMGNLIILPTGSVFVLNGAALGTAGYGNQSWAIGQSYADEPVLTPVLYNPAAPLGQRWSGDGLSPSTIPRMYHSTAILLPDGSILVSGSNPNADYTVGKGVKYPTEYRVEKLYPSYFNHRRPEPKNVPSSLSYGGPYFNISLSSEDLGGNAESIKNVTAVIIRTGFSTHTMNMGQRYLQLETSYTGNEDGSAVLHVSQMPPSAAIFQPGPALFFVVVNGVPSVGVQVMIGTGKIETQPVQNVAALPSSNIITASSSSGSGSGSGSGDHHSTSSASLTASFDQLFVHALIPGVVAGLFMVASLI